MRLWWSNVQRDSFFFPRKTGLLGPTASFWNRRDELHSVWAGYKVALEGRLERLASTPPDFVEVAGRGRLSTLKQLASTFWCIQRVTLFNPQLRISQIL